MNEVSRKVVIIGAGHVGSHCAYSLAFKGDASEIVFIDLDHIKASAQAGDIMDCVNFMPHKIIVRVGDYSDCTDASIVILAAGVPRKPGQTRLDTMSDSINVMKDIVPKLKTSGFEGILLCISNPADVVTKYMLNHTGFEKKKVFGTGTSLDTSRLKRILSDQLDRDPKSIGSLVMGEHGDSSMIPFSHVTIGGKSLLDLKKEQVEPYSSINFDKILNRVRTVGMDIINGKNSTEFGIGTVASQIVGSILNDEKKAYPLSVLLEGQYGEKDICIGVPAVIGRSGILEVLELNMTQHEMDMFKNSCDIVREHSRAAESL
ncbi:L-lactate dehydrogenase [Alkalibacter mobilis]|uniref:L-lactate dehydrogenase n=1 Tax=Alkalibacter mobilis TaxID=2787712 RepID=UPI00189D4781|nr:L-lactate dehydrogenase [Alkalibacter mobilis]